MSIPPYQIFLIDDFKGKRSIAVQHSNPTKSVAIAMKRYSKKFVEKIRSLSS